MYFNFGLATLGVDHPYGGERTRHTVEAVAECERTSTIHSFARCLRINSVSICIEAVKCYWALTGTEALRDL
jgi:hypothetical protein